MKKVKVRIELDPVNDGIENLKSFTEVNDDRGLIVSTTGEWRAISCEEMFSILEQMKDNEVIIMDEYLGCINTEKILNLSGDRYFVGSIVAFKSGGQCSPVASLTKFDVEHILQEFNSRLVEIMINGESIAALSLE